MDGGFSRHEVQISIDDEWGLGIPLTYAATVAIPDTAAPPALVAFGYPGGGYGRRYFDIHHECLPGPSQMDYHVSRGWVFVACDPIGVGDSSQPDPRLLTTSVMAASSHRTAKEILRRLRAGTLIEDVGPLALGATLGMGQSLGGLQLVAQQGGHGSFDAIAVLGFSVIRTLVPEPEGLIMTDIVPADATDTAVLDEAWAPLMQDAVDRWSWAFYFDDVPRQIVEEDMAGGFPLRTPPVPYWASAAALPAAAVTAQNPGVVADEAARIDVPVLVAVGERDVVPDPSGEPAAYSSSPDVTVVEISHMAHMHNFASSREPLWRRLHEWAETAVDRAGSGRDGA
jgi:pimeloyl-ACP methyl ester carboxylesterase